MALHRMKVPRAGQSVEVMIVLEWHIKPGAPVARGDDLVTVGAEKVDIVIPCVVDGLLIEVLAAQGEEVMVGDPLCVIESDS